MLHFLEMKIDDIDGMVYECESIVSSNQNVNVTYQYRLEKVDEYLKSTDLER